MNSDNQPVQIRLIKKMSYYNDKDFIESHVSFKVSIKSSKGISVIRSGFIVEEGHQ